MDRSFSTSPLNHRADIDGLRAFAVLGVLLYHFKLPGLELAGGFTGVDVFLVISGFLITQILVRDSAQPKFLTNFLVRRFRRIFPALITVIGASLIAGYFILTSHDFAALADQTRAATFALSNFYFLANTGYFDPDAELQPLLHTWSLAVEEQFYLVWPLIILCFARFGRRVLFGVALAIVGMSLWYSEVLATNDPTTAFYAPWSRAWELALGAALALLPRLGLAPSTAIMLRISGVILVTTSFLWLGENDKFPGVNALYACLGAALLVLPIQDQTWVCRFLGASPFKAIGLISYSLYLWHWPVLVYYQHYQNSSAIPLLTGLALIGLSVGLATMSYFFIEKPFRYGAMSKPANQLAGFGSVLTVLVAALIITQTAGLKNRFSEASQILSDKDIAWKWKPKTSPKLPKGLRKGVAFGADWNNSAYKVLVWGDSHAAHITPLVERVLNKENKPYAGVLYHTCPAIVDNEQVRVEHQGELYNLYCGNSRAEMLNFLASTKYKPDIIVLASSWYSLASRVNIHTPDETKHVVADELAKITSQLANYAPQVTIITQLPLWSFDPIPCQVAADGGIIRSNCEILGENLKPLFWEQNSRLLALKNDNLSIISPGDRLCKNAVCTSHIGDEFLYRDQSHLRRNLSPAALDGLAKKLGLERLLDANSI